MTSSASKTFLQLVGKLREECYVAGANPTSLTGQNSEINRLISWINQAWMDIQVERNDWLFMRKDVSFTATAGVGSYSPTDIGMPLLAGYKRDSFRAYATALGVSNEQIFPAMDYDTFRDLYLFGANRTLTARPVAFTVDEAKNMLLGPVPNEPFVVSGKAYLQPTEMAAAEDVPTLPAQFHMLIVYKAMTDYGAAEVAPEVYDRAKLRYNAMFAKLLIDQTPTIHFGGPLA